MKYLMLLMICASFITVSAFAGETTTDCPMMKETNERSNPKANLGNIKTKVKKGKNNAVTVQ